MFGLRRKSRVDPDVGRVAQLADPVRLRVVSRVMSRLRAEEDQGVVVRGVRFKMRTWEREKQRPWACLVEALRRPRKKRTGRAKARGNLPGCSRREGRSHVMIDDEVERWPSCEIWIKGAKLYFFVRIDEQDGSPVGVNLISEFSLVPKTTSIEIRDGLLQFSVLWKDGSYQLVAFYGQTEELFQKCKEARAQLVLEETLGREFEQGTLGGKYCIQSAEEYRWWLDQGLVTQAEFEVLRNQQITSEIEYLQQDTALYGEEGIPNYKVTCPDCFEQIYVLPIGEPIEECMRCGHVLPTAQELEEGAATVRAYLLRRDEQLAGGAPRKASFAETVTGTYGYPILTRLSLTKTFRIDYPEVVLDDDGSWTFQLDCSLRTKIGYQPSELSSWTIVRNWAEFQGLYNLIQEHQSDTGDQYAPVPEFPEDVADQLSVKFISDARLPLVANWLADLMNEAEGLDDISANPVFQAFFELPEDLKIETPEESPLDLV